MAFAGSFAAGFVLKSCSQPLQCLGVRTFCYTSRPLRTFPRHNVFRTAVQTRTFSRTIPAFSASKIVEANTEVTSTSLEQGATATINATEPSSFSSEIIENAIDHLPAALQYGDFAAMGLTGFTPAAIVRCLFWRFILFPFVIAGLRNSAKLLPLQPQLLKAQEDMTKIKQKGDTLALQKQVLKMKKMYDDAGVNMGTTFLSPFIQVPVTLGVFFGVKTMCQLPVPQLTHSGLSILQDLTVPDPYMILPIAFCAAVNLQISVGTAELNLNGRPGMAHLMNGLRILSVLGIFVMNSFPSGLLVSLLVTSMATTIQSLVLQIPAVRRAVGIPIVSPKHKAKLPSFRDSYQFLVTEWKRKLAEAGAEAGRQRRRR
ncbi:60Kd inner membrane protein-domain-containing protein [Amanita rubescens]|nr:60Kd inner membrane protein-domain-containing protein [Amanita rubescens]